MKWKNGEFTYAKSTMLLIIRVFVPRLRKIKILRFSLRDLNTWKDFPFFFTRSFNIERFCDFLYTFSEYVKILGFSLHVTRLNLSNLRTPFPSGMR